MIEESGEMRDERGERAVETNFEKIDASLATRFVIINLMWFWYTVRDAP